MKTARMLFVVAMLFGVAAGARGEYEYVGSGDKTAKVLVEFGDGAIYGFGVYFSDPSTTGFDLMSTIDAGTTLDTTLKYYEGLGTMIVGLSYKGHSDINAPYDPNDPWSPLWWHYWVNPPADWELPWDYGAGGRIVSDGCADAWVFGHDDPPHLPGDATGDVTVNGGDLAVITGNWMATSGKTWAEGDFTGEGAVDSGDLALLTGNWMFGEFPDPAPVPEPATMAALAAGFAVLGSRRR